MSDDPLYHVAFAGAIESIQRHGLRPGTGGKFGGGYEEHSRGKLFVTEPEGVFFWHSRIEATVTPIEGAGEVPVVLRFVLTDDEEEAMEEDPLGTRDAPGTSYMLEEGIEPERLELWTGDEWEPLEDVVEEDVLDLIQDNAELEEEDGEEWYDYDPDVLLPPDEEL